MALKPGGYVTERFRPYFRLCVGLFGIITKSAEEPVFRVHLTQSSSPIQDLFPATSRIP